MSTEISISLIAISLTILAVIALTVGIYLILILKYLSKTIHEAEMALKKVSYARDFLKKTVQRMWL